ncbi:MAG: LPS export ABC transporter periplasmic protein LptC [Gemmatimonadaceae bacterium]
MIRAVSVLVLAGMLSAACQGNSPAPPVAKAGALPDSADQMMFGVWFLLSDAGVRRAEVRADTAYMYDQNTRTDLRKVKTDFFKATGEKNATLTSLTGQYNSRLGTMEARGMVVVITTDGRKLESPQLRYDPGRNEISSDSVFVLTQTDRRIEGIGFISDPDLKNIKVLRNAKAFGQEITIPKQ